MNFLAHLYLSGDNRDVMIGNFIGDFVKGKAFEDFPTDIQKGILLHREIDRYTDDHEIVTESKKRLRPKYRHYAPVIVDIFYDHFIASLWNSYHKTELMEFTQSFYSLTDAYTSILPAGARHMLTYMRRDNWLYNYQFVEGIGLALSGLSRRTPFNSKMEEASKDLKKDYAAYQIEFERFFPDLIHHSNLTLSNL